MARKIHFLRAPTELPPIWRKFYRSVRNAATQGLTDAGAIVIEEANKLVPVQTGALKASGRARTRRLGGNFGDPELNVSYGGNYRVKPTKNAPTGFVRYAVQRHENVALPNSKWLQRAASNTREAQKKAVERELRRINRRFRI